MAERWIVHPATGRAAQSRLVPRLREGRLYDFLEERIHDRRKIRLLNIIDEFTHECLSIRVAHRLKSIDVIDVLSDLFILRGVPEHIRSDNGPEFLAKAVQEWIAAVGAKTAYITPGSPWENGFVESFMYGPRVIAVEAVSNR
jgi:transposase InsO family protein